MGGTLQGPKFLSVALILAFVAIPCIAVQALSQGTESQFKHKVT